MDLDFAAFREARWERNSYRKIILSLLIPELAELLTSLVAVASLMFYEYCESFEQVSLDWRFSVILSQGYNWAMRYICATSVSLRI